MMKYFFIYISLFFCFDLISQAPSKFYQRFGGNGYDVGYDVKQTLDSGYIITGSTSSFGAGNTDLYLTKLDKMGQLKFQKTFGNYNNENGKSVIQLLDSSYVMLGYTNSVGFGGYDMYLVKADKTGTLLWQKNYGGVDWDFGNSLKQTADGGFIIAGTTYSFGRGNADGYIIKTDALGNITWTKTYGGANDDEFKSVIQTSDGGYALTGYSKSYGDATFGDLWAFKLNATGDSTWCKFYVGVKEDYGNCIIELQNLDILISGGTKSSSIGGYNQTLMVTYSVTGIQVQSSVFPSPQEEYFNGVAQSTKGNIANCGTTKNPVFGFDAMIEMYNASYVYVNFFSTGGNNYEELFSISKTFDKGFVAVGKTNSYNSILDDIFFMKMDSVGNYGISYTDINDDKVLLDNDIIVFPNPTNGIVNVKIGNKNIYTDLKFTLIDLNGAIIYFEKLNNDSFQFDFKDLCNGMYFIQIYDSNNLIKTMKLSVISN